MKKSKYQPIEDFLKAKNEKTIKLTFKEFESILGKSLPQSASIIPGWWSNDSKSHVQSIAWLNAGYKVSEKELGKFVIFTKG